MDSNDSEVLLEEVNLAQKNVIEAAQAVTSAENHLEALQTLKRKRRGGATKSAFEKAERALADASREHEMLVQVHALKENALANVRQATNVIPSSEHGVPLPDPSSLNASANDTPVIPLTVRLSTTPQLHAPVEAERAGVHLADPSSPNAIGIDTPAIPLTVGLSPTPQLRAPEEAERTGVHPASPDASTINTPTIPPTIHPSPTPQPRALGVANTSLRSSTSAPIISADEMDVDDRNAQAARQTPEDGVSMEMNGDINMHTDIENGATSPDLQERKSILDGYEATAASHRSKLRHLEELFNDWGMGKGIPATMDRLLVSTTLEDANRSMSEARDGLERAEKAYKEFLSSTLADCRSSALRDVLQLTRDQMTTKGVGVVEAGRWKGIFHLAEDELREIDEQALFAFRLGIPEVEPTPKKKTKDTQKGQKGKREKKEKADDDEKKPSDSLALRQRWLEVSEEEREKLQVAAEAAINRYLTNGTSIDSSLKRKIREIVELAPQAGTTSRELSLHILERNNQICRHHGRYRTEDSFAKFDTVTSIEGVGYKKDYTRNAAENHIDCGCSIELALWDFFWFKTWSVGSSHIRKITNLWQVVIAWRSVAGVMDLAPHRHDFDLRIN